ncbi:alpha-protein kinase 2 [Colius striatus]|nr:alpha-protein kinase 2 [Colius striatus]
MTCCSSCVTLESDTNPQLSRNSFEQASTPSVNHNCFAKGDSEGSATIWGAQAEEFRSVSNDFSDDDLEYFECSDVLTADENEMWKKKLQFLLESDDEDDLKLSRDCDGCAYFLSDMPCLLQVSDNTTPMDTTIGFCGHHSKFEGVNVRRDPSMYSQSTLQAEMTLTVGHHRDKSNSVKDKEKHEAPVASAAIENDHPGTEEEENGSGHTATGFSTDKSKNKDNTRAKVDSSTPGIGASSANQASETVTENTTDKHSLGESSLAFSSFAVHKISTTLWQHIVFLCKLGEVNRSVNSTECGKDEEVMTSECEVNGLVNLSQAGSGNNQNFQEQHLCSRAQPFSLAVATYDLMPVNTGRLKNQEGSKSHQTSPTVAEPEPMKCKQDAAPSGHLTAGAKKKLPSATVSKKPRLEERGKVSKDPSCVRKSVKSEAGLTHREDRREQRKTILKKDSKAPKLLKKIQAEWFPDCPGNIKLCCQFGNIHADSTITWTKDSKLLSRLQRSAQDDSPVSLAIAKSSNKDQGIYYCCLSNTYGKVTAEFNLTSEVLEHLSSFQTCEGVEEIEFMQLMFREDFISDSYFGGNLHGVIATEELHFGEGMHRKAFRSKVMQGLVPVFSPGHACVLKVHNAVTYGTKSKDDLVQKNYKLALQECYVQNTAREYAKIYAAEAEPLEGFGEVPEIIPIFLVHRPANNIPYATVEEELVGEFVKYSVRDGKEVNFLRRDSEAGQKCCTFQHWVYDKTNGSLLVTDLQGVGMKLTDVGIATLAKGYKGFKGNCSISFIEQFRALHQCNKYCEMLGLKPLRTAHQKQRKATAMKSKNLPNSSTVKKVVPKKAREPRGFISSEH